MARHSLTVDDATRALSELLAYVPPLNRIQQLEVVLHRTNSSGGNSSGNGSTFGFSLQQASSRATLWPVVCLVASSNRAGLHPLRVGDFVTHVNGKPTRGKALSKVVRNVARCKKPLVLALVRKVPMTTPRTSGQAYSMELHASVGAGMAASAFTRTHSLQCACMHVDPSGNRHVHLQHAAGAHMDPQPRVTENTVICHDGDCTDHGHVHITTAHAHDGSNARSATSLNLGTSTSTSTSTSTRHRSQNMMHMNAAEPQVADPRRHARPVSRGPALQHQACEELQQMGFGLEEVTDAMATHTGQACTVLNDCTACTN